MKSIGLVIDSVVPLGEIKTLIRNPDIQSVELVNGRNLVTTASLQVLGPNASYVSSSHCQAGQGSTVANMRIIPIDSHEVIDQAIGSNCTLSGGTRKKIRSRSRRRSRRSRRSRNKRTRNKRTRKR